MRFFMCLLALMLLALPVKAANSLQTLSLLPSPKLVGQAYTQQALLKWQENRCMSADETLRRVVVLEGGTGIVLDNRTLLTAYHVVFNRYTRQERAKAIIAPVWAANAATFTPEVWETAFTILHKDPQHDVAIIRLTNKTLQGVQPVTLLDDNTHLVEHAMLAAVGNPGGHDRLEMRPVSYLHTSITSQLEGGASYNGLLPAQPRMYFAGEAEGGMSGGALLTCNGQLAGMITHVATDPNRDFGLWRGLAIPVSMLNSILR